MKSATQIAGKATTQPEDKAIIQPAGKILAVCGYDRCQSVAEFDAALDHPAGGVLALVDGNQVWFSSQECFSKFLAHRTRLCREHRG